MIDASKFSLDFLRPTGSPLSATQPSVSQGILHQEASDVVAKLANADPWEKAVAHYGPLIEKTVEQFGGETHVVDILQKGVEEIKKLDRDQLYNIVYRMIGSHQLTLVAEPSPQEYNPKIAVPKKQ